MVPCILKPLGPRSACHCFTLLHGLHALRNIAALRCLLSNTRNLPAGMSCCATCDVWGPCAQEGLGGTPKMNHDRSLRDAHQPARASNSQSSLSSMGSKMLASTKLTLLDLIHQYKSSRTSTDVASAQRRKVWRCFTFLKSEIARLWPVYRGLQILTELMLRAAGEARERLQVLRCSSGRAGRHLCARCADDVPNQAASSSGQQLRNDPWGEATGNHKRCRVHPCTQTICPRC